MNKQKTLIFSLSVILFLALSFIVYSWKEPTTPMPSGYTAPLNTSSNFQEKYGPLIFSMMYDGDTCDDPLTENCPYYINPSGNSVLDGDITTSGNIITAYPTEVGHVATKGYIDGLFSNVEQEVSLSNLIYVNGTNPSCPDDSIIIMRHWLERTCSSSSCNDPKKCSTLVGWFESSPACSYCPYYGNYQTCAANSWDAAICAKIGTPLFNSHHTEEQCRIWGGETVIVEEDVKICKMNSASCPGGWTQYKNWSTTVPSPSAFPDDPINQTYYYTGSHTWSNTGVEYLMCKKCPGLSSLKGYYFCGLSDNCGGSWYYSYATITQIGCY